MKNSIKGHIVYTLILVDHDEPNGTTTVGCISENYATIERGVENFIRNSFDLQKKLCQEYQGKPNNEEFVKMLQTLNSYDVKEYVSKALDELKHYKRSHDYVNHVTYMVATTQISWLSETPHKQSLQN